MPEQFLTSLRCTNLGIMDRIFASFNPFRSLLFTQTYKTFYKSANKTFFVNSRSSSALRQHFPVIYVKQYLFSLSFLCVRPEIFLCLKIFHIWYLINLLKCRYPTPFILFPSGLFFRCFLAQVLGKKYVCRWRKSFPTSSFLGWEVAEK